MEGGTRRSLTWLRPRRSRLCRVQLPALPPPPTRAAQPISARRRRRRWPMNRVNASPPSATGRQSTPFSSTASLSRDPARSAARGGTQRPAPNEKSQRVPLLPIRGRSTFPLRKGWAPTGGGGGRENNRGGITRAGGAPSSDRPVTRPPSPPPPPARRSCARGEPAAVGPVGGRRPEGEAGGLGAEGPPHPLPNSPPGVRVPHRPPAQAAAARPGPWCGLASGEPGPLPGSAASLPRPERCPGQGGGALDSRHRVGAPRSRGVAGLPNGPAEAFGW